MLVTILLSKGDVSANGYLLALLLGFILIHTYKTLTTLLGPCFMTARQTSASSVYTAD